jgi:hypothetical protein
VKVALFYGAGAHAVKATKDRYFQMRVDEQFLKRLDDVRRAEPDLPSRAQMARRLIDLACATTQFQQLLNSGSLDPFAQLAEVMARIPARDSLHLLKELQARLEQEQEGSSHKRVASGRTARRRAVLG